MLSEDYKKSVDEIIRKTRLQAPQVMILFVTNIIEGEITHYHENGLSMSSQYYYPSEVSFVIQALESIGFSVKPFYNESDFIKFAMKTSKEQYRKKWPLVVTTAEGGTGEGRRALIPAFCNLVGLPCWNSPAHGCSTARHKFHANTILRSLGLNAPESWFFRFPENDWLHGNSPSPGKKVIIKPAWESGSKGIDDESVVVSSEEITNTVKERVLKFQQSCIVQEFKTGFEVGVPVVTIPETTAAGIIGFSDGENERYGERPRTFEDEKINKSSRNFPFNYLCKEQSNRVKELAVKAFDALSMKGLGRIDFRIDEDGEGWIFDTNEAPPPLPGSSFIELFVNEGYEYHDVLAFMIGVNLKRFSYI